MSVTAPSGQLVDVVSPEGKTYAVNNNQVAITLPPMTGAILIPQDQVK
jgi:hypothetical protein